MSEKNTRFRDDPPTEGRVRPRKFVAPQPSPARVARYAEAICRAESVWLNLSDAPEEVQAEYQREARAVVAVADEEHAALVAEVERLRERVADRELARVYERNNARAYLRQVEQEQAARGVAHRQAREAEARAEAAEAKVAKVEALHHHVGTPAGGYCDHDGDPWPCDTAVALADAPAEQRAEGGACREASFSENACAEHGGEWVYEDDGITLRPECSRADEFRDAQAGA